MGGGQSLPDSKCVKGDVVIIPVDQSKQAETAFEWYVKHVYQPNHKLHILYCEERTAVHPFFPDHTSKNESWSDHIEKAKKTSSELINKYEQKLKQYNMEGSVKTQVGKPGEIIVNEAVNSNASHIVMGTRGYGIVRRTILGSVSGYVIHHSTVPVTVVPKETQNWFF